MSDKIQAMDYSGERLDSKLMAPEETALVCPASDFWAKLYSGKQRTIISQPGYISDRRVSGADWQGQEVRERRWLRSQELKGKNEKVDGVMLGMNIELHI